METYEIEFKVKGLAVCKDDTLLTGEMKFLRKDEDKFSFYVLIAEQISDPKEAVNTAISRLNLYLDYYNLFFRQALKIENDGRPVSVAKIKDGKILGESFAMSISLGPLFTPSEEIKKTSIEILTLLSEPRNGYLRVAIDYNRRASLEKEGTDELIHLFIALEALYSTENEKQEIQHRFSSRIATLLGKNHKDRIELRKRAKKLYTIRSKIVHGSQKFQADKIEDLVSWTKESILRFLILSNEHTNSKHEDLIEMIGVPMLDNKLRTKIRKESKDAIKYAKSTKKKTKN